MALKKVSKIISLMEAVHKLHDPQCELLLIRNCAGVLGFGDWQWRLATLQFKLGGLGILSAGDIIQYAFLASRLQTNDLQAKIPMVLTLIVILFNVLLMFSTLHAMSTCSLSPLALLPPNDENLGEVLLWCH
uniref:Uncharacterized protein n=1 Tax=Tanacetum cinerariifolium TaxID=118510 RepID=A0A6L2LM53_TANCI|nr:hypothetical protein [Tanacetum cinerariifolium]